MHVPVQLTVAWLAVAPHARDASRVPPPARSLKATSSVSALRWTCKRLASRLRLSTGLCASSRQEVRPAMMRI